MQNIKCFHHKNGIFMILNNKKMVKNMKNTIIAQLKIIYIKKTVQYLIAFKGINSLKRILNL